MSKLFNSSDEILNDIFNTSNELYKKICLYQKGTENRNEIFRLLTDLGKILVDADRVSFWKWDKKSHSLWTLAAVGEDRITIPENTGIVGKSLSSKKAIVINDPYDCPDFNSSVDEKTGYTTKSILVMPVSNCNGEFIGAYQAINKLSNDGKFDLEEDCRRLSLAALICGITLESETFFENSQHDKLTGLKNRMAFDNDFSSDFSELIKQGRNVTMFISDIDHFKRVNDTYGHNAGDAVLCHTAGILNETKPENCQIYRWGGEEFIMLLPDNTTETVAVLAEEIRKKIEASVCTFEGTDIKITMSFGISQFDKITPTEEVIKSADEKLYTAKNTGRNKVVI